MEIGSDPSLKPGKLPPPQKADDGSLVYQPLIMISINITDINADLFVEFTPENPSACPQYLVMARLA